MTVDLRVPVAGGELGGIVHRPDASSTVLAIHGITANSRSWAAVARELPDVRVIAPDLRGRGSSGTLPGPFTFDAQVDDLVAVLDHVGVDSVVVAGHSMGAFIAVWLAHRHPDRVSGLVLVDGGIPLPTVPDPAAALGPAMERLSVEFPSRDAYRGFWKVHPALGPYWNDDLDAYVDHDLVGTEPHLRSSVNPEAVLTNVVELDGRNGYREAVAQLKHPVGFLRAPRGLFDEVPALYPEDRVPEIRELLRSEVIEVPDVNHYTIVLGPGAPRVAHTITAVSVKKP